MVMIRILEKFGHLFIKGQKEQLCNIIPHLTFVTWKVWCHTSKKKGLPISYLAKYLLLKALGNAFFYLLSATTISTSSSTPFHAVTIMCPILQEHGAVTATALSFAQPYKNQLPKEAKHACMICSEATVLHSPFPGRKEEETTTLVMKVFWGHVKQCSIWWFGITILIISLLSMPQKRNKIIDTNIHPFNFHSSYTP